LSNGTRNEKRRKVSPGRSFDRIYCDFMYDILS